MVATADIAVAAQIIPLNSPGGTSVHLVGYMVPRAQKPDPQTVS